MEDEQWKVFFTIAAHMLGVGSSQAATSKSWCLIMHQRLLEEGWGCCYYAQGFPAITALHDSYIDESSSFSQPMSYADISHIVIPASFYKGTSNGLVNQGKQDIKLFSNKLTEANILHRITDATLEIRLY